jgi:cytoskeleton protein RodZ
MQTLGDIFRAAREKRKITASQAAAATHMKIQHVEAIEDNAFEKFAAPTYAKGFIKLYAEYLGLDPVPLLREYAERHMPSKRNSLMPEASPPPAEARPKAAPPPPSSAAPSAPAFDLRRLAALIREKAVAWTSAARAAARRMSWKRPVGAAAVILLAVLVARVARCAGDLAGQRKTPAAYSASEPMSAIVREPPEPYLPVEAPPP